MKEPLTNFSLKKHSTNLRKEVPKVSPALAGLWYAFGVWQHSLTLGTLIYFRHFSSL